MTPGTRTDVLSSYVDDVLGALRRDTLAISIVRERFIFDEKQAEEFPSVHLGMQLTEEPQGDYDIIHISMEL